MSKRAAIYKRVSSGPQEEGASLDTQEAAARLYCKEHGYIVDEASVYTEVYLMCNT